MAKGFDLAAALGGVSILDTAAPVIEMIDVGMIDANKANFYELSNLQPLANSIALDGLQQPLVVMTSPEDPKRVVLISGHRRLAAIKLLLEDPKEPRPDLRQVPCIRKAYKSEAAAELQLILANSTARELTSSEKMRQAEQVERLLYQLKEEGVSFPGKMRDQVAEACKMSASKLARLKVIREKLAPGLMPLFENGKFNETVAYALAQQPADRQAKIVAGRKPEYLREWTVEKNAKAMDTFAKIKCYHLPGGHCTNTDAMFAEYNRENNYDYMPCTDSATCCGKCSHLYTCKAACPQYAEKIKAKRAADRAASKAEKQSQAAKDAQLMGIKRDLWLRFGEARKRSGVSIKTAYDVLTKYYGGDWREKEVTAREDGAGPYTASMDTPYSGVDAHCIVALADLLSCSVDFLFLKTDIPAAGCPAAPIERQPAEDDRKLVRWMDRREEIPVDHPILTANHTNAGTVYRAARLLLNGRYYDTGNPCKELNGLQFSYWLEIPWLNNDETYVFDGPKAPAPTTAEEWRSGTDYPRRAWIVALLGLGSQEPLRKVIYVDSEGALSFGKSQPHIDAVPLGWYPLPEVQSDIKTEAAREDVEGDDNDAAE